MKNIFVSLVLLLLAFLQPGNSQDESAKDLPYEVNKIYQSLSVTKAALNEAKSIVDLNPYYKPIWIREYISVEILTRYQGKEHKALSKNDTLSQQQKNIMNLAEVGSAVSVVVHYIPENTLKHNERKVIDFTFTFDAENDADFPGGPQQLKQYLWENGIDKIPDASFVDYDLAAVKFTIDENGHIIDPHIFWPSKDEKIDALLLETICNMPNWKPAEYANGLKVKQEFVLTVGNMQNCAVNLLNIRRC